MGLLAIILPLVAVYWFRQWIKEDIKAINPGSVFVIIGTICSVIIGVCVICSNAPQTVKAAVAPRLVIVEHLRGLTK
jgi:hypothetical protein